MRFAFIEAEKAHHSIRKMCTMLNVRRSGFCAFGYLGAISSEKTP